MGIVFFTEPQDLEFLKYAADEASRLYKGFENLEIRLICHRIKGRRSFVSSCGPVQKANLTEPAAAEIARAIGARRISRSSADMQNIVIELALSPQTFAALAKSPSVLTRAILRGLSEESGQSVKTADNASEFDEYLAANPSKGFIRIQVFSGKSPIPISGAKVTVSKTLSEKYVLSTVFTDRNGQTPLIQLPAKPALMSQTPEGAIPYTTYDILVEKDDYLSVQNLNVPVFDGIISVQPVRMNADTGGSGEVFDEKSDYRL